MPITHEICVRMQRNAATGAASCFLWPRRAAWAIIGPTFTRINLGRPFFFRSLRTALAHRDARAPEVKISGDNLPSSLARQLQTIYLVSGDEPLLVNEAADAIRATARSQGFAERELHVIERGFDWQGLIADSRSMSLFAERKIVEIRMANAAPGEQGADAIVELAEQPSPDTLVLIIAAKLDGRTQSSRWVSAVEKRGVLVQVWPIDLPRLPAWIRERLGRHKLQADAAAASLLAERVEGNLLAAHQEIEKLALLLPPGPITAETVVDAVADSARFDVLQLGEAAMRGQTARALRILDGLRGEDVEPTLVLWAVNKDLQWIARARNLMRRGQSAESAMNTLYVWRPRQAAMGQALSRTNGHTLRNLLLDAERVDRTIKGVEKGNPWLALERLVARLAGVKVATVA
jgi:DNA polymerase III subunit delta